MITKIKAPLREGKRVLEVNGKPQLLYGSSTWFTNQVRGSNNPKDVVDRHIAAMKASNLNATRVWFWTRKDSKVFPKENFSYSIDPPYGTTRFYDRLYYVLTRYIEEDIVPIVIVSRAREGADSREDWSWTEKDRTNISQMIEAVDDLPLIWDMMNESPREARGWLKKATAFLKKLDTYNRPVTINTGFGGDGFSEEALIDLCRTMNIHGYALLDGSTSVPDDLFAIADTDHSKAVLQERDGKKKVSWFNKQIDRGASVLLNMEGFQESWFHPDRNSSDVNNPSIPVVWEYFKSLSGVEPPQEPPDVDPRFLELQTQIRESLGLINQIIND